MKERAEQQVKVHSCTRSAATDNARPRLFKLEKGGSWGGRWRGQQIAGCGLRQDNIWWVGGQAVGDTWHGDKAESRRSVPKKGLLPRLSGQFAGNRDLIKIDEGNGPSRRRRWGLGGETRRTK